jgi:N-acyl-D-amino-acid deacylase
MRRIVLRWLPVLLLAVASALLPVGGAAPEKADIPATGAADKRLASFDRMMTDFLHKYPKVPGGAIAVARDGKIVYSRGFGYADPEHKHHVQPNSQFRIASISKPLTAVAVLQLVERGKLGLNDKVFDVLKLQEPEGKNVKFDPRWRKVTIAHLLHHTGGWDRDKAFDPMVASPDVCKELQAPPPAKPEDIIHYMLRRPLQHEPGSTYVYSNFGFCLLGRVIEKVSGKKYEDYVRQEVLQPVGAHDTRLGRTLPDGRFPNEVWYDTGDARGTAIMGPHLGKPVPLAYGAWCLESMDSHGGWIATAPDLVRFASAFDHPDRCKLLKAASIETMFAPPPGEPGHDGNGKVKAAHYACGWEVHREGKDGRNTWHAGLLDGTSTILVRRTDGLTWAVLFNSSTAGKEQPVGIIDALVHEAANAVKEWP